MLLRQEPGTLVIEGFACADGRDLCLHRDYGQILDLGLKNGVGRLLVEWVGQAPRVWEFEELDFAFTSAVWRPRSVAE